MKLTTLIASALLLLPISVRAQEAPPEMPKPVKQHEWLAQLAGEWESSMKCVIEPGKPPMEGKSTEKARLLGGFWIVSEGQGEMMGSIFSSVLTIGYDPAKEKFVGTWVDSMTSTMWQYTGTLDEATNTLTLESRGPCPMQGGKICNFKEVIVVKDKDTKTFTSHIQGEDGEWTEIMSASSKRKK
ncbi:DUF1579 domain-containing protein [Luteolibacter flavescens]|uniref:DUF1579 domain-containing protein n=1 Tax=Luteolibacter flavescens TaxID=1859460 RepID=A0ABT3FTB4_9BACT|nr:DUF1579 domain-containing protein [Luteolibacter flavescens]MCW1886818.1 DUF1579 domain-containing protein [Luteolibacter flavescens]